MLGFGDTLPLLRRKSAQVEGLSEDMLLSDHSWLDYRDEKECCTQGEQRAIEHSITVEYQTDQSYSKERDAHPEEQAVGPEAAPADDRYRQDVSSPCRVQHGAVCPASRY